LFAVDELLASANFRIGLLPELEPKEIVPSSPLSLPPLSLLFGPKPPVLALEQAAIQVTGTATPKAHNERIRISL
jgi:hypothetical protein